LVPAIGQSSGPTIDRTPRDVSDVPLIGKAPGALNEFGQRAHVGLVGPTDWMLAWKASNEARGRGPVTTEDLYP
jgi:hypothetical protein